MIDVLDLKVRQMHAALDGLSSADLSAISVHIGESENCYYTHVDFNEGTDDAGLANAASLLIAKIASIKDHLKVWCKQQGVPFEGDKLINSNRSVALVHDLWNVDKHAELRDPPRSGHIPKLIDHRRVLKLSSGAGAGSGSFFSMDPRTGKVTTGTTGGGSVALALVAQVVDENGQSLGEFTQLCTEAIDAWKTALSNAGVPLQ